MTSVQLGQRLMSDLDVQDLSLLSANSRLSLLDAINTGIQLIHAHGPAHWKTVPSSVTLAAPRTVQITLTKGSNQFSGFSIDPQDIYCSIQIPGDKLMHQIISNTELLDDYLGESGTYTATIYHDAVAIYEPVERLATDPRIIDEYNRALRRIDSYRHLTWSQYRRGEPDCYWIEPNARNNNPIASMVLRVNSLPTNAIRLRYDVELSPARIEFVDLSKPKEIPVRGDLIEAYLKPIIRRELTTSSLWKDDSIKNEVREAGDIAEKKIKFLSINTMGHNINKVGTPARF